MVQVAPCARCRVLPCSGKELRKTKRRGRRAGKSQQEKEFLVQTLHRGRESVCVVQSELEPWSSTLRFVGAKSCMSKLKGSFFLKSLP